MSTKLTNLTLIFPTNVLIIFNNNYLILKGPFGTFKKNIISNKLIFNLNSLKIKYFNKYFNKISLIMYKKNYFMYKLQYHNLIVNLKKTIEYISIGFLSLLQVWGIGYKILKKNNNIYLFLGYNNTIEYKKKNQLFLKPFNGTYLFLTGYLKEDLLLFSTTIKNLKKKDKYKGKGIRFLNEKIQLKINKRD